MTKGIKIKPSDLILSEITHQQILNGQLKLPLLVHQLGILKECHSFFMNEGKNRFVPITSREIEKRLKKTLFSQYIPSDGIENDIKIMANRGWFQSANAVDGIVFTDYAKEILLAS